MSAADKKLPDLPTDDVHAQMQHYMDHHAPDIPAAVRLIGEHPGLARTDAEFLKRFERPWIYEAIDLNSPELVQALLATGCSPFLDNPALAHQAFSQPVVAPVNKPFLAILKALALHPECDLSREGNDRRLVFINLAHLIKDNAAPELDAPLHELFLSVLERTPDAALHSPLTGILNSSRKPKNAEKNIIFLMRAMVDRGLSFDEPSADESFHSLNNALFKKYTALAAAMLAAGVDDSGPGVKNSSFGSMKDYIDGNYSHLRVTAAQILQDEIDKAATRKQTPQHMLITPAGRPTWQAKGLLMQGRIMEVFAPEYAEHFGGGPQQAACAIALDKAFSEKHRLRFDLAARLRQSPLARPSDSAVVGYLRGGADVAHGGKA